MKKCFKCGAEKERSEFYRHKQMADGLLGKCKECAKKDVRKQRVDNGEYVRAYDRARGNRLTDEYIRQYSKKNPRKIAAIAAVSRAKRKGVLIKQPCEVCGTTQNIHAHHDDYAKPLDVRWLCAMHHRRWHAEHGESPNGN